MESWQIIIFITIVLIIYLLALTKIKVQHAQCKSISKNISAKVIEYKMEHGSPLGDDGSRYYAYVKIELENKEFIHQKLEHVIGHVSLSPFKKGENIDVFWYGEKLFYWNSYQTGIFKFLPSKWGF